MHNVYNVSYNIYPAYYMVRKPNLNQKKIEHNTHHKKSKSILYLGYLILLMIKNADQSIVVPE